MSVFFLGSLEMNRIADLTDRPSTTSRLSTDVFVLRSDSFPMIPEKRLPFLNCATNHK